MPRERLDALLDQLWRHRLGLVVAPAGSGKTTLLARFAARAEVPVAWYRAETWDGDVDDLLRHLSSALAGTLARDGAAADLEWETVEAAVAALEAWPGARILVVVDDLHSLEGSPAEAALERLIDYAPPSLHILAGSRTQPGFNLSRLRVSGDLLEIGSDDLRFRSWEVERLFRDFYGQALPPTDLALVARRTEGWAAGLQLFHLATRDKSPDERRRILGEAGLSSRVVREYLTRNVLGELAPAVRQFLVETSVLGRLNAALCDRLLGEEGTSHGILADLERRQLFTSAIEDEHDTYRYHEVLRAHLESLLVEQFGEADARARYRRAGALLEEATAVPDALRAYCRAEAWDAVERLLGRQGRELVDGSVEWLDTLPPAIVRHDPWLVLAGARRARADGRWSAAVEAYGRAERVFGGADGAALCRRERLALSAWLDPTPPPPRPGDWWGLVRSAVVREPLTIARLASGLPLAYRDFVAGLAALLAGHVDSARPALERAAEEPELAPSLAAAARLGAGVASILGGDAGGTATIEQASNEAERHGAVWLARLGRAAAVLGPREDGASGSAAVRVAFSADSHPWGEALVGLFEAWGAIHSADLRLASAERSSASFRRLGGAVLEAWSRGLHALALARSGSADARDAALAAESFGRTTGTSAARLFAYLALGLIERERSEEYGLLAESVQRESGLALPPASPDPDEASPRRNDGPDRAATGSQAGSPSIELRCLGSFAMTIDGRVVDTTAIRPRVRALLRLLAIHTGTGVHREVIAEALWPEVDAETSARSLHVAVSALRRLLEPGVGRGGSRLIVRDGDTYRLDLPPDAVVDVAAFADDVNRAIRARNAGDSRAAAVCFLRALDLYAGDLLPGDGPAEWVVDRREQLRRLAVVAAESLAELAIAAGDGAAAAWACTSGLRIDRYHDPLWRNLIAARELAGDPGAAGRARQEYETVLAGLGVGPSPS